MALFIRSRTRGINFLLGGTLVAVAFTAFLAFGGSLDLGIGAPKVRIDEPTAFAGTSPD
ncbi:hypothetical protein [Jannaschia ovalis]|uniref:Uncharacterized protein n=1 Tax=Jannaschia ovalis TaxID=3038773 RepID=A0ABY8LEY3_9RHOB|nr:hypothetical protein [Jannaschia sp. GRR-S6-38]WGH78650.1 hypothetical protein P8627_16810 [Jannaschia sp. GRR-S6-38]